MSDIHKYPEVDEMAKILNLFYEHRIDDLVNGVSEEVKSFKIDLPAVDRAVTEMEKYNNRRNTYTPLYLADEEGTVYRTW